MVVLRLLLFFYICSNSLHDTNYLFIYIRILSKHCELFRILIDRLTLCSSMLITTKRYQKILSRQILITRIWTCIKHLIWQRGKRELLKWLSNKRAVLTFRDDVKMPTRTAIPQTQLEWRMQWRNSVLMYQLTLAGCRCCTS